MTITDSNASEYLKLSDLRGALEDSGHLISQNRLIQLCNLGSIKGERTNGGHWRIHRSEYDRVLGERGGRPARVNPDKPRKNYQSHTIEEYTRTLYRRYGIDINEYQRLYDMQDGKCAICKLDPTIEYAHMHAKSQRLNVDHDHTTGKVRGLLCHLCNKWVANAGDRVDIVREVLAYLDSSGSHLDR